MRRTALLLIFVFAFPWIQPAFAQECLDYGEHIHWTEQMRFRDYSTSHDFHQVHDVAVAGDFAYLALGELGMVKVDITDRSRCFEEWRWGMDEYAGGLALSSRFALVAVQEDGIVVIDVDDPYTWGTVALDTPGSVQGIVTADTCAYVADGSGGLRVLNTAHLPALAELGSLETIYPAEAVDVVGDRAYLATGAGGLEIVDVSDPGAPGFLGARIFGGWAHDVTVVGDFAFLAAGTIGLVVVDVSNPIDPRHVVDLDLTAEALSLTVAGGRAYVVCNGSGGGLQVIDVSQPWDPVLMGALRMESLHYGMDRRVGVATDDGHAFVAFDIFGLNVADISSPHPAPIRAVEETPEFAMDVELDGGLAYVSDEISGLQIYDMSTPTVPAPFGTVAGITRATELVIAGEHAYVIDYSTGFRVVDISDPSTAAVVGSFGNGGDYYFWGLDVAGDYAYLVGEHNSMTVVDIGTPAAPVFAANCTLPVYGAYDVAVGGNFAYVATESGGLQVVNIYHPTAPTIAGEFNHGYLYRSVEVVGDTAYAGLGTGELHIFDVSTPSQPALIGVAPTFSYFPGDIEIVDRYAYVGGSLGCAIIDVAVPTDPVLAGWMPVGVGGLDFDGEVLCGAGGTGGFLVLYPYCEGGPVGIDDPVDEPEGEVPAAHAALAAHPNPFNPLTTISFGLDRAGPIKLVAYDVRGRRVRGLAQGFHDSGPQQVNWDGRDDAGREVPSGTYFVRLVTGTRIRTSKLMLVR